MCRPGRELNPAPHIKRNVPAKPRTRAAQPTTRQIKRMPGHPGPRPDAPRCYVLTPAEWEWLRVNGESHFGPARHETPGFTGSKHSRTYKPGFAAWTSSRGKHGAADDTYLFKSDAFFPAYAPAGRGTTRALGAVKPGSPREEWTANLLATPLPATRVGPSNRVHNKDASFPHRAFLHEVWGHGINGWGHDHPHPLMNAKFRELKSGGRYTTIDEIHDMAIATIAEVPVLQLIYHTDPLTEEVLPANLA